MPDIVVTDIRMPGIDGVELTRIIKERHSHIEVIVLSSFNDFEYVKETLMLGALDYILKPKMQYSDLLIALEKAKGRNDGDPSDSWRQMPEQQTESPIESPFYGEIGSVAMESRYDEHSEHFDISFKRIHEYVDKHDFEGIYLHMKKHVEDCLSEGRRIAPQALRNGLVESCYYILHRLEDLGYDTSELHRLKNERLKMIESGRSYETCMRAFMLVLEWFHSFLNDNRKSQVNRTIQSVLDYVHKRYGENISLQSAAQHFHLNKSYLSQLFKRQTGENFNNYLTRIRIDKAKELLRQSDQNIYTVSQATGFENPSYFGQVFKRMVGMKPSEYVKLYRSHS